jgi:hypothetical protein
MLICALIMLVIVGVTIIILAICDAVKGPNAVSEKFMGW